MAGDYDVGYGKPPARTRFSKGQSGNPKGRPKGTKNLKTDLLEELQEQIQVREGNRDRRLSKQRALLKSLTAKAIKGDARSANVVLNLVMRMLEDQPPALVDEDIAGNDRELLEAYSARIIKDAGQGASLESAAASDGDEPTDGKVSPTGMGASLVKP
jgi:hypothetical protein